MDRITANLLETFIEEQGVAGKAAAHAFEKFANYSVLSHEYPEEFEVEEVTVAGAGDTGLDGLAVIANGSLITSDEEIDDLCDLNNFLDVEFIFVQAKTSASFDAGDIGKFFFAVKDFFSDAPGLQRNEGIAAASKIKDRVFDKSALLTRGNPRLKMFYVTCGRWNDDPNLVARIAAETRDLQAYNIFSQIDFTPVDASTLQQYFRETRSHSSASIIFPYHVALPDIAGVREAYIGILPGPEYLSLIVDDSGNIRKSLFYDNVRDFQGANAVNQKIDETIASGQLDQFAIRNNGITIVARALTRIGNRFNVEDYQIVNGCQTSHVLYNRRDAIDQRVMVPVKLIVTDDDAITNATIESTNSQTEVKPEELQALSAFQKKLEDYFNTFEGDRRLHYERRSRQYSNVPGIEKVRIVSIGYQIRYFAAMFLDEPHRAGRYYATLLKLVGGRVFGHHHYPDPYYTAAYAAYKLDFLFRNGVIENRYRLFRYHILMGSRYIMQPEAAPAFHSKRIEQYCGAMNETLWDAAGSQQVFQSAIDHIQAALDASGLEFTRDTAKTQTFRDAVLKALDVAKPDGASA